MRRTILAIVLGLAVSGAVLVSANSIGGLGSPRLGAGSTLVASCDTDGVSVDYGVTWDGTAQAHVVETATVGGIDADCLDGELSVSVHGPEGTSGGGPVTVTGASAAVTLSSPVTASSVERVAVLIEGGTGPA